MPRLPPRQLTVPVQEVPAKRELMTQVPVKENPVNKELMGKVPPKKGPGKKNPVKDAGKCSQKDKEIPTATGNPLVDKNKGTYLPISPFRKRPSEAVGLFCTLAFNNLEDLLDEDSSSSDS